MGRPSCPLLGILSVILTGCLAADYGWQPQTEYVFAVQGKDLAGLPQLKPQYAGFSYSGALRVQSHTPRVLLLKFLDMNYTKLHDEFPEGWWKDAESQSNKTTIFPITTSTIVVKLTRSMSPEIVVQADLDDWQVNFIKGIVNNLLAYQSENLSSGSNSNRIFPSQTKDVYSVFEDSVVGRCEVLYKVSQLPKLMAPGNSRLCEQQQLWEVTKTHNYNNCQLLSEDHAHLPTKDCTPGGANCGHFWTRASLTNMVGCGEKNNFVLLSSVSSSSISAQLHLQNNSQAVINSNLNITLISASDLKSKFNPPQNTQVLKSLLYSYTASTKDFSSRSCQEENSRKSGENTLDKHEHNSETDPKHKNTKSNKESHKSQNENSESRNKRSIKTKYGKMYRTNSNESRNKNDRNSNGHGSNKRMFYDENTKNSTGSKGKHNQPSSGESSEQPSEEMQLEEQWNISGKDQKNMPPHQPFNMFSLAHRTSFDLSCLYPEMGQIVSEIAHDLEEINILPEKNTLGKLSLAVDICRSLPHDQLSSIAEDVFEVHSGAHSTMKNNQRKVFRDVITMCGTHPALRLIMGWVERRQVEGEEAAQIISSLPSHVLSPSNYFVQDFFEMVQKITEKEDQQLSITAVLALSNLVRDACVNQVSRQHHFSSIVKPVCDQQSATQVTDWLAHQLESQGKLRRVYVEALGNIGSPEVIPILRDIVLNPKYSSYLQNSAVFAMRYQAMRGTPGIAQLLMSMYSNYKLPVGTRIAAASLLVYSAPNMAMWQQLAISTWWDPSPAVAQFVSSTLLTMATSRDSLYFHVTNAAQLVQSLAKPSRASTHHPYNLLTSWVSSDLEKVILQQLSWMQFYDVTNLYYRHSSRYSGFSRTNIEMSVATANPDGLWRSLKELIILTNDNQSARPPSSEISRTLNKIQKTLDLHTRSMPEQQADLHLKINNMMERMLIVNKDSLRSWTEGGQKFFSEDLRQGKSQYYQKADMNSFHISTTTQLGFPVEFKVRTPWIIKAKGDLNFTDVGITLGTAFVYSSQLQSSVSVMSAWDNIAHSAGAQATNFVQLPPIRMTASLDTQVEEVKLVTSYIDQHRLLYFQMQPFTSQRKLKLHQATLLSPDTFKVKMGESIQMPISWMSRYLNTVYSSEVTENFNPLDFIRQSRGVMGFHLMSPNMEARSFETVMNPFHPVVMNFSMTFASKSMGLLELESPRETILGELFNALTQTRKSEKTPSSSAKPNKSKAADSGNNEPTPNSPEADEATTNTTAATNTTTATENQSKEESSAEKKTKQFIEDEKVLMRSSEPFNGGYQVYSTTYESFTGSFNASIVNPFTHTVNGSGNSYLMEQILSQINSGRAVGLRFNLWSNHPEQPTKLSAYAAYAITHSKRASRLGLFMKSYSPQDYLVKFTSGLEAPVDIASDLRRRVTEDLQHNAFLDSVIISGGQVTNAFIQARLGVSRAGLTQLRASPLLDTCSQLGYDHSDSAIDLKCQQLHAQAKEMTFGNITVYYNENAKLLENTARMYMIAAKVMLPRTEEKSGEGHNTLTMMYDIDQRTNSVNTYITTPISSLNIRRLPLSKIMSTIAGLASQDSMPTEYCGISAHRVRTFNGAEFQYKMNNNWHLVTQDCTGKYGISVIAQASNNDSMIIELNMNDHFTLTVEEGPRVYVNNKLQPLDASHPLLHLMDRKGQVMAHTVFTPDSSIHISLPQDKLDLLYSGTSVIIRAEQGLEGRLCGLCGSYSNTGMEEYLTAQGSAANSPAQFAASYMFKSSKSSKPQHRGTGN